MVKKRHGSWLIIGAIGVVFGDIGTSPLYALQAIFGISNFTLSARDVIGVISLIIWAVTFVVTFKYVGLIMRANNNGEGGIMALIAIVRRLALNHRYKIILTLLGLIGVSLFYGDSVITPAISVLSAIEGIRLIEPSLAPLVVPITLIVLSGLFLLQSRGTGVIGILFGPIMALWFIVSGIGGFMQLISYPPILEALLPTTALGFFLSHPLQGFVAMGAVILAITGAEALYADMGHFGRPAITRAWLGLVFPALMLNYLGQGALVIQHSGAISSSYFLLFPDYLQIPIIILATVATLIASQAVIAGAFSLTRQAIHLGFAPRMTVTHTSREEVGQVYLPALNWAIATLVVMIVVAFGSSAHLAGAFGMAVSGTLAIDSILLLVVMRKLWKRPMPLVIIVGAFLLTVDILFLTSSSSKLLHGAWLPILIAIIGFTLLTTWYKGHTIVARERNRAEGTLLSFVRQLHHSHIPRVPGYAIYLGHNAGNTPLALHETVNRLHELHEAVVVVTVETADIPHVSERSRIVFDELGHPDDGISHVTVRFGYKDSHNVPRALEHARSKSPEIDFDPDEATYFTSITQPAITHNHRMAHWRKLLYTVMDRNAIDPTTYFHLPLDRTVAMSTFVEL